MRSANHAFSPRTGIRYRLFRRLGILIAQGLFHIRIVGCENVPQGNCIVVANHLNWIDPLLVALALPAEPRVYFIGAEQILNRPWKKRLMAHTNEAILVERGARWVGRSIFERPLQVLASDASLALFPEGDNGPCEGTLGPVQRGIGHFLVRANYPVLPIAISGTKDLYLGKEITVTIGEPFHVKCAGLAHHAAVSSATEQVEKHLRALIPPYVEPEVAHKWLRFLADPLG